jgi:hypothetical protein
LLLLLLLPMLLLMLLLLMSLSSSLLLSSSSSSSSSLFLSSSLLLLLLNTALIAELDEIFLAQGPGATALTASMESAYTKNAADVVKIWWQLPDTLMYKV